MVGERDGGGGSSLWAPAETARRAVVRSHENVVTAWEDVQLADPGEGGQGLRLLEYWRIVYKHKWLILAVVAVTLAIGVAVTLMTPKVYTASTTLEIDRETSNVVGMGDVAPMDKLARDQEFFQTQYGLLKSWSLAARVAQSENLANDPTFLQAIGIKHPRKARGGDGSWVAGMLEGGLGVYPVRDSRLVRLTFDSPNPALSARIANAFADNFIASNLERRFEASAYARSFLEQRLAELKAKLEDSERQLVAYATQQQIIQISQPGGGKDAPPPQSLDATNLGGIDAGADHRQGQPGDGRAALARHPGRARPFRARHPLRPDRAAAASGPGQAAGAVQRSAQDL